MKILVVYYSMYGNTFELAKHVVEGCKLVEGAEVVLKQVPDLIPSEVIEKAPKIQEAKEKQKNIPIATPLEIADYDAIIWGTPTRYGNVCAQMRNFLDQTAPLWLKGKLEGKVSGVFTSTASIHGGQETTIVSAMLPLFHLGMIVVGVPYSTPELISSQSGGTPYGPSHVAGIAADMPITQDEATIARVFGKRIAEVTKKLIRIC